MISAFEIYKIGVGPSSSHTVGPMKAACEFTHELIQKDLIINTTKLVADVYGSLSLTGLGHHTDLAIIMGLAGNLPATVNIEAIPEFIAKVKETKKLSILDGKYIVDFPFATSMNFHDHCLALHENGMTLSAYNNDELLYTKTYYSIGGGAIVDEENYGKENTSEVAVPFPFNSAETLLQHCTEQNISIAELIEQNELAMHSQAELDEYFVQVGKTMREGIEKGIMEEGELPGPYKVPRRAKLLHDKLIRESGSVDPLQILDWINLYAMAVAEVNASGGRVVTAPTNGACGIIPAVLAYYDNFVARLSLAEYKKFYFTSSAIGILYKLNASISGAEVGCQGEVGVACSMAAAGLAELLGGSPQQVCHAAEIGMEHNLGLTCDPLGGQVQVPCVERNGIASVKAINSARMALQRESVPIVSLDDVITTMYATGKDINAKYRETSLGGLAITVKTKCS